jgi:hypothetical protein
MNFGAFLNSDQVPYSPTRSGMGNAVRPDHLFVAEEHFVVVHLEGLMAIDDTHRPQLLGRRVAINNR